MQLTLPGTVTTRWGRFVLAVRGREICLDIEWHHLQHPMDFGEDLQ